MPLQKTDSPQQYSGAPLLHSPAEQHLATDNATSFNDKKTLHPPLNQRRVQPNSLPSAKSAAPPLLRQVSTNLLESFHTARQSPDESPMSQSVQSIGSFGNPKDSGVLSLIRDMAALDLLKDSAPLEKSSAPSSNASNSLHEDHQQIHDFIDMLNNAPKAQIEAPSVKAEDLGDTDKDDINAFLSMLDKARAIDFPKQTRLSLKELTKKLDTIQRD